MLAVASKPRQRLTLDLRGLGPGLAAHAKARHLTVSEVVRLAVAAVLEAPPPADQPVTSDPAAAHQLEKLTIRLQRCVAGRLKTRSRACGLSHGAYLTTLIDGTPAPALALVAALNASTDRLAVVCTDVREVMSRESRDGSGGASTTLCQGFIDAAYAHLGLASRVVAEVRPGRTAQALRQGRQARGERGDR